MNSCILLVELINDPQLRYTADAQIPIAEMEVQFSNLGNDSRPAILKTIAWGKLGQEASQKYRAGDRLIIEGSLSMNLIERPEGFKEKRAELKASKIYSLDEEAGDSPDRVSRRDYADAVSQAPQEQNYRANVVSMESRRPTAASQGERTKSDRAFDEDKDFSASPTTETSTSQGDEEGDDYDPIPF